MSRKTRIVRQRGAFFPAGTVALEIAGYERISMLHLVYEKGRHGARPEHVVKKRTDFGYQAEKCAKRLLSNGRKER